MKILANLGKLANGRTALVIEDAYKPNFVIADGYDPSTKSWNGAGRYFDGNLTEFAKAITDANLAIGYDRMKQIAHDYITNDYEATECSYVYGVLTDWLGMEADEIRELGLEYIKDACSEE